MKKLFASLLLLASVASGGTAYAHHMAEGIVSDDIWQMIDDLLVAADSPHLDLDFTTMGSAIVSSIEVESDMVDDILAAMQAYNNGRLVVATQPGDNGLTEIIIVETIGNGESQTVDW